MESKAIPDTHGNIGLATTARVPLGWVRQKVLHLPANLCIRPVEEHTGRLPGTGGLMPGSPVMKGTTVVLGAVAKPAHP